MIVLRSGEPLRDSLDNERVTVEELKEAARLGGYGDPGDIDHAVLETDGKLSFIPARTKTKGGP